MPVLEDIPGIEDLRKSLAKLLDPLTNTIMADRWDGLNTALELARTGVWSSIPLSYRSHPLVVMALHYRLNSPDYVWYHGSKCHLELANQILRHPKAIFKAHADAGMMTWSSEDTVILYLDNLVPLCRQIHVWGDLDPYCVDSMVTFPAHVIVISRFSPKAHLDSAEKFLRLQRRFAFRLIMREVSMAEPMTPDDDPPALPWPSS